MFLSNQGYCNKISVCTSIKLLNCHWWYKSKCTLSERCVRFVVMWSWVIFAASLGKFWVVQLYGYEVSRPSVCPLLWKSMILGWHIIYSVKSSNRVIDVCRYWTIVSLLKLSDHSDLRLNIGSPPLCKHWWKRLIFSFFMPGN